MIEITAQGKFIDTKEIAHLFTQGEKYSDFIYFILAGKNNDVDISDCTFILRSAAQNGEMTESILEKNFQEKSIKLSWRPSELVTAVPGMLRLELIASKGSECIVKYRMPAIFVKEAVMGTSLPVPDIIEEKLSLINETLSNAVELQRNAEELNAQTESLKNRTEELAEQINIDSDFAAEVIASRRGTKTLETHSSLNERLEADFTECVTFNNLFVNLDNEFAKARKEWQTSIQEALGTAENSLSEVVDPPETSE